jgi:hypothetical protein
MTPNQGDCEFHSEAPLDLELTVVPALVESLRPPFMALSRMLNPTLEAILEEHGQVLALVGEQQPVAHGDAGVVGVEHDRQAEQQAAAGAVVGHHRLVVLLVHEAAQGREATHHQQFHIAGVAVAAGHHPIHPGAHRLPLVGGHHQVHQGASVGLDQTGRGDRHGRRGRQGQVILPDGGHWSGRPGLWRRRPAGMPTRRGNGHKKGPPEGA